MPISQQLRDDIEAIPWNDPWVKTKNWRMYEELAQDLHAAGCPDEFIVSILQRAYDAAVDEQYTNDFDDDSKDFGRDGPPLAIGA